MSILSLPNELLIQIVGYLPRERDLCALAFVNRHLAAVAIPILHRLALKDKDELTALQWAISPHHGYSRSIGTQHSKYEGLVRLLLSKGVDVDYFDSRSDGGCFSYISDVGPHRSNPALHLAVMCGQITILRILLKHGANINIKNKLGHTALHLATNYNLEEAALILLENGADISTPSRNFKEQTPLHLAATNSAYAVVAAILKRGGNIHDRDEADATVLHSAVQAIVSTSREVEDRDEAGAAVFDSAVQAIVFTSRKVEVRISVIRLLLESGVAVSARDNDRKTPLHYAAQASVGGKDVIRLLLEKGADLEAKDFAGRTPLLMAVLQREETTVEILLEAGADILSMIRDETIVEAAAYKSQHDMDWHYNSRILRLILGEPKRLEKYLGCKPDGGKLMFWAAERDLAGIVGMLLDKGVDISAQHQCWPYSQTPNKATALHWAVIFGSEKVVSLLLRRGADTAIPADVDNRSAFEWAVQSKKPEIRGLFFTARRPYRSAENLGQAVVPPLPATSTGGNSSPGCFARLRRFFS